MATVERIVEPGSPLFNAVQTLGDDNRSSLGLLPHAAWADYANARHICAIVDEATPDTPLAYVAYRTPRNEIVIAHLVVREDSRRSGLARRLIDGLRVRYPERLGILLRCRRDYEAHQMWPKLGFVARGEEPGRGKQPRVLTRWWLDFGHPTLLTWDGPADSLVPVMIDMNILIDLTCDSPGAEEQQTRRVFDSLHDRIEVIVSPEAANEIDRNPAEAERRRLRASLGAYTEISVDQAALERVDMQLADKSGARSSESLQNRSDRKHIAYAAAAGVTTVVTRDGPARRRLGPASKKMFEINIVTPSALVGLVDEIENTSQYAPGPLLGTAYRRAEAGVDNSRDVDDFISTANSERRRDFQRLRDHISAAKPASSMQIVYNPSQAPVALIGIDGSENHATVRVARMKKNPLAVSLASQLVQNIRDFGLKHEKKVIRVLDDHIDGLIREALISDGFHPTTSGLVGVGLDRYLTKTEFEAEIESVIASLNGYDEEQSVLAEAVGRIHARSEPNRSASIEHEFRPVRYDSGELPTWLVPIKPQFSIDLFGYPLQLFERPSNLGLSREHVYYKTRSSGETAPGRIIWYVSGNNGEAFASSSLIEVVDGNALELHRRFNRLGVYTYEQVEAQAGTNNRARALRVADTVVFDNPVSLRRIQHLGSTVRQRLPGMSSVRLAPEVASTIIREGQFGNK